MAYVMCLWNRCVGWVLSRCLCLCLCMSEAVSWEIGVWMEGVYPWGVWGKYREGSLSVCETAILGHRLRYQNHTPIYLNIKPSLRRHQTIFFASTSSHLPHRNKSANIFLGEHHNGVVKYSSLF